MNEKAAERFTSEQVELLQTFSRALAAALQPPAQDCLQALKVNSFIVK